MNDIHGFKRGERVRTPTGSTGRVIPVSEARMKRALRHGGGTEFLGAGLVHVEGDDGSIDSWFPDRISRIDLAADSERKLP